ncbi:MAG: SDR family oxidoreductase [Opitutales bacterium]
MRILVTGATGYIGGRLVPRLFDAGHSVTVLVRQRRRMDGRPWADKVHVVEGDLNEPEVCRRALEGQEAAYFLVHGMTAGSGFENRDRRAAETFTTAAPDDCHIIYLGGIQPADTEHPSPHLASRAEVGQILNRNGQCTEFRAGPVIGSGSASFEMVRYLTERLPVMVTPRWVTNEVQPIAIRDVLSYLKAALEHPPAGIINIGMEPLTFRQMMHGYATCRGMKRWIFPLPVLAPRLAARWVGLVTPITNKIAIPLVEGILQPLTADTTDARRRYPDIEPIDYQTAVDLALQRIRERHVPTRWSGSIAEEDTSTFEDMEGIFRETRSRESTASPEALYRTAASIGGDKGWLTWRWAWKVRGLIDQLVGGPGLRRGRRDPEELLIGEAVDFWRVEKADEPHFLRLRAEMRMPGRAWLQWEISPRSGGGTRLTQTALFAPKGLPGLLYWYSTWILHLFIFPGMVRAMVREAEKRSRLQVD